MASTYPLTPDVFTTNVDGVDDVLAADMNLVQDAIAALQKVVAAGAAGFNLLADSLCHDNWLGGLTFNDFTDDTYLSSLWNGLHNGQPPDVAGTAGGSSDPFTRYLKCTFDSASSQFGIVQFLDAATTKALRGQTVSISADLWGTTVTGMRMAVIEWAGTADTLTSDVVGTWAAGNPTLATSWSYIGTPATITITGSRVRYSVENIAISSTVNNLAVFIWTPALQGSTDVINIARVKMEIGALASPFAPTDPALERLRINKYLWVIDQTSNATNNGFGVKIGTTQILTTHSLPVQMRAGGVIISNVTGYTASAPGTTTIGLIDYIRVAFFAITGALTITFFAVSPQSVTILYTAGTSWDGTIGNLATLRVGPSAILGVDARL